MIQAVEYSIYLVKILHYERVEKGNYQLVGNITVPVSASSKPQARKLAQEAYGLPPMVRIGRIAKGPSS